MGSGSWEAASQYAKLYEESNITGVDINPESVEFCRLMFAGQENLDFQQWDIENMIFKTWSIDAILNSSTLHHVSSFNDYSKDNVHTSIKNQISQLKDGGILFIRDFLIPSKDKDVLLELSTEARACSCEPLGKWCRSQFCQLSDAELFEDFCKTARSLHKTPGYPMMEIESQKPGFKRYKISHRHATEFILRKDYRQSWGVELQEAYTYSTQEGFEEVFRKNGMRILTSYPYRNPWIVENRFKNKFFIYDDDWRSIDYPPTNYIIVGQKVSETSEYGTSIIERTRELIQVSTPNSDTFLNRRSYKNADWEIWDIVERPWEVSDIIPYYISDDWQVFVNIRFWAPRPILWLSGQSLDRKNFDSYTCEPHSISTLSDQDNINERLGLLNEDGDISNWLSYYPSAWVLWEQVSAKYIQYDSLPPQNTLPKISGFWYSWEARTIDINDLLRAIQTGAMPEARTEINLYHLLRTLKKNPHDWIGDMISIESLAIEQEKIVDIQAIRSSNSEKRFELSNTTGNYIKHFKASFEEVIEVWEIKKSLWKDTLEYVTLNSKSDNVVSALPVVRNSNDWRVYVGIEKQHFPTVQEKTWNSGLWTVPAYRLGKDIRSHTDLENFSRKNIGHAGLQKLWESYKTSMWITPETVYPHIISEVIDNPWVVFITLDELIENIECIQDVHLLVVLFRLNHIINSLDSEVQ